MKTASDSTRLTNPQPWVAWLPMVVVTLPTVCLLWFMGQAVGNERLAVRQKLTEAYARVLADLQADTQRRWADAMALPGQDLPSEPAALFAACVLTAVRERSGLCMDGLLVCDRAGRVVYPKAEARPLEEPSQVSASAWQAEYLHGDFAEAAAQYQAIAERVDATDQKVQALIGAVRCLDKAGRAEQALTMARQTLERFGPDAFAGPPMGWFNLQIQAVGLLRDPNSPRFMAEAEALLAKATDYTSVTLPSQERAFVLTKAINLAEACPGHSRGSAQVARALRDAELLSLRAAEYLLKSDLFDRWPAGGLIRLDLDGPVYAHGLSRSDHPILVLVDHEHMVRRLQAILRQGLPQTLDFRITDEKGLPVHEAKTSGAALVSGPMGGFLPGWSVEVFLKSDQVLEDSARHQQMLYIWTGTLVICLSLVAGALVTRQVHAQVRLNRLKNDFIATVTHELKTPLASMRLLVDTLLEGRTRDSRQAQEYLQMIARENVRLTGLIDNFLTFSRMERNKQAFDLQPTDPRIVVQDAAQAVRAKFEQAGCMFEVQIAPDLPQILADRDALVTVLVNLLDNAFKYSGPSKEISLRAYAVEGQVCLAVADNGIGIPRRLQRRVFDRFFQVDQTLSREVGGCGLGLAIVRFIMVGHGGTIRVDSAVGKGSTFVVKIPRVR